MIDIEIVKRLIVGDLSKLSRLDEIAERLNVNPETLRKQFLRTERVPISEFLISKRIEEMMRQLRNTEEPCYKICFEVGFKREDTGAKAFKRTTGMTMREFRENCDRSDGEGEQRERDRKSKKERR